jgi:hypothetical protein
MKQNETETIDAARGYYDAFVTASRELVRRHFLPSAAKTGAMYDYERQQFMSTVVHHDFQQIIEFASQYNVDGHMPRTEPHFVVLDAQDQTAVVKMTAEWASNRWGTDYVSLVRSGEKWMIANIVWQSTV